MLSNLTEADIRLIRVFAKVVEAGGFSAAQIDLNVSQSTISTHMTTLEHRLGVRLCERGRSGFSLTERGQLIYQACQRLFTALDAFSADAGAARNCLTGTLVVGIVDSLVTNPDCALQQAISAFHALAPEVQISIRVTSPAEVERMVLEGSCSLGLGTCGEHSPYLSYEDLFYERQVIYCGRGHELFDTHLSVRPDDLKHHQFVQRAYSAPERLPKGLTLGAVATADLMEGVAAFILSGKFIGYLPKHTAQPWIALDRMRPLLESKLGYQNPVYLATHKTEAKTPVVKAFLEHLRAAHVPSRPTKRLLGVPTAV